MVFPKKKIDPDIMTAERLRAWWFEGPKVPFWNYDPNQLTMGIEVEYFIGRMIGSKYELATKKQYLAVTDHLIKNYGYHDYNLKDQAGRVSRDTSAGFIAIKPDFAWHILEVALPPRAREDELRSLLTEVFAEIDSALASQGLQRLDLSCLPDIPKKMELVELDRLRLHMRILEKLSKKTHDYVSVFPALIAATHIHINVFREDALSLLPDLYADEHEFIARYCRKQYFRGKESQLHRTTFYEKSLGDSYRLKTIPEYIARSVDDYCKQFNTSPHLFPQNPFFPVRDLSYIRPTKHGTFEYRSACSYLEINKLIEISLARKDHFLKVFKFHNEILKKNGTFT